LVDENSLEKAKTLDDCCLRGSSSGQLSWTKDEGEKKEEEKEEKK